MCRLDPYNTKRYKRGKTMAPTHRPNLVTVMAKATSPTARSSPGHSAEQEALAVCISITTQKNQAQCHKRWPYC